MPPLRPHWPRGDRACLRRDGRRRRSAGATRARSSVRTELGIHRCGDAAAIERGSRRTTTGDSNTQAACATAATVRAHKINTRFGPRTKAARTPSAHHPTAGRCRRTRTCCSRDQDQEHQGRQLHRVLLHGARWTASRGRRGCCTRCFARRRAHHVPHPEPRAMRKLSFVGVARPTEARALRVLRRGARSRVRPRFDGLL
jgi:hypothetical protein